ncbi:Uncharacterised protein [uncultured archaeon]|nr:Uncharacterised protein [uncultured archaeon]
MKGEQGVSRQMPLRLCTADEEKAYVAVGDHIGHDLLNPQVLSLAGSNDGSAAHTKLAGQSNHRYPTFRIADNVVSAHRRPGIIKTS